MSSIYIPSIGYVNPENCRVDMEGKYGVLLHSKPRWSRCLSRYLDVLVLEKERESSPTSGHHYRLKMREGDCTKIFQHFFFLFQPFRLEKPFEQPSALAEEVLLEKHDLKRMEIQATISRETLNRLICGQAETSTTSAFLEKVRKIETDAKNDLSNREEFQAKERELREIQEEIDAFSEKKRS